MINMNALISMQLSCTLPSCKEWRDRFGATRGRSITRRHASRLTWYYSRNDSLHDIIYTGSSTVDTGLGYTIDPWLGGTTRIKVVNKHGFRDRDKLGDCQCDIVLFEKCQPERMCK